MNDEREVTDEEMDSQEIMCPNTGDAIESCDCPDHS